MITFWGIDVGNPYATVLGLPQRGNKPKKAKPSPSHVRANKQEKEIAKRLNGKCTPASGAGSVKGDVRVKGLVRVEAKTTKNKSFPVTLALVHKIEQAALEGNEIPVLVVGFNDEFGNPLGEVCVIPVWVLNEFCEVQS